MWQSAAGYASSMVQSRIDTDLVASLCVSVLDRSASHTACGTASCCSMLAPLVSKPLASTHEAEHLTLEGTWLACLSATRSAMGAQRRCVQLLRLRMCVPVFTGPLIGWRRSSPLALDGARARGYAVPDAADRCAIKSLTPMFVTESA